MIYERTLDLNHLLASKSLLLLGPRQVGKSTLLLSSFAGARYVNLAESDTFRELTSFPERLRQSLSPSTRILIIDEAQRVPEIFNEVQVLLDRDKDLRIILTGSSARKLRRSNVNLLPGRIWQRQLRPLISQELRSARINDRVVRGSLPAIIDSDNFKEDLRNYIGLYLDEEVRAEGLTRNFSTFNRFLPIAALCNAEQVNFTRIAQDLQVAPNTVRTYFEILEDTLIASRLEPFRKTKTRKAVAIPKIYFFDCGVVNAILNRFDISPESELFGKTLEHLIFQELLAYKSYVNQELELNYWRTHSQFEVDFIINGEIAVEVKASRTIHPRDEKALHALVEDVPLRRRIIVCQEASWRRTDTGVEIFPVEKFFEELWSGNLV